MKLCDVLGQHLAEDDILDRYGEPGPVVGVGSLRAEPVPEPQLSPCFLRRCGGHLVATSDDHPAEDVPLDVHPPVERCANSSAAVDLPDAEIPVMSTIG